MWGFLNLLLHPFFSPVALSQISSFLAIWALILLSEISLMIFKYFNFFMVKNIFFLQNFFSRKLFNIILYHFLVFFNLEISTSYFCTFCYFFFSFCSIVLKLQFFIFLERFSSFFSNYFVIYFFEKWISFFFGIKVFYLQVNISLSFLLCNKFASLRLIF